MKDNPGLLPQKLGAFVPWRMILDPRARLTGRERLFKDRYAYRTVWLVGPGLSPKRERAARNFGADVLKFKSRPLADFVREAVTWMAAKPLRRVLVEGGSQTLGAFLRAGLADEMLLYLAPKLIGGERSKGIFSGAGARPITALPQLAGMEVSKVGPWICRIKGYAFTGIIEQKGRVEALHPQADGARLVLAQDAALPCALGDSLSVNGVCLTVAALDKGAYEFDLSPETLSAAAWEPWGLATG